jgi:hypothetical protein
MFKISVLIICLLSFFRYYFFLSSKSKTGKYLQKGPYGDAATYLFLIQFFRINMSGVSDKRCLLGNYRVLYPSFFLRLVSKIFDDEILFKKSWLPNYILFIFCLIIFVSILNISFGSFENLLLMSLIFFFQTDNTFFNKDRIHFIALQPRYLGIISNSFLFLIYVLFEQNIFSFLTIIFLMFLSLNNSLFGRQNTFFVVLVLTLISLDFFLIICFVISFIISIIIYPNEFLPSLKPQIKFSISYFYNYYSAKKSGKFFEDFIKKLFSRTIFESYPYFTFFITTALLIKIMFFNMEDFSLIGNDLAIFRKVFHVYISVLTVFLITGFRKFAFLGECWRYISFTTYFLNPIFLVKLLQINFSSSLCLSLVIIITVIQLIFLKTYKLYVNKNDSLFELLNLDKVEYSQAVWYSVPYRAATIAVTKGFGIKTSEFQYGHFYFEEFFSKYPFLKWDKKILKKNKITHILVEKEYLEEAKEYSNFSFKELKLISENKDYSIHKI